MRHVRRASSAPTASTWCGPPPEAPHARASCPGEGKRVAAIVNDMSEVNIDAAPVRGGEAALVDDAEEEAGLAAWSTFEDPLPAWA